MDGKAKTQPRDALRVNLDDDYELRFWTARFGVTVGELKAAVARVGPMARDVEDELKTGAESRQSARH